MTLLSLTNVSAFYGSSQALFKINLRINEGQVVALMGRNGMGKTTTIKTIFGMVKPAGGEILFDAHNIKGRASHVIAKMGLGLVPEGRRCFAKLSVYENLIVAEQQGHWNFKRVTELFPRLNERREQLATTLSGGEQQMLAIGRALMTNPRFLVLDEATEGLSPIVRQEIWTAITTLKNQTGMSILVVDKSLKELSQIADEAVIIQRGETVWHGAIDNLSHEVTNQYLGI